MSVGERNGDAIGREAGEAVNRVGGEARLGLLPVADHRGLGRFEAFDGVTERRVLKAGELVARQPTGGELLHCRDELGGSGNAADGLSGNGHRARLSAVVAMSMALAPVLGFRRDAAHRLEKLIWRVRSAEFAMRSRRVV